MEFVSKREILGMILTVFGNEDESKEIRSVGKTYKNIDGNIYFIKHKICPCCQTEPIGKMHLIKDVKADNINGCVRNSGHIKWILIIKRSFNIIQDISF